MSTTTRVVSRLRYSLVLVSAGALAVMACGDADPPLGEEGGVGVASATIGAGGEARQGVDLESVIGCLDGCVEMEQGLLAMSNPKNVERHMARLAEKKDQCFGMFELLEAAEREALMTTALAPLTQCLGDRIPCLGQCRELEATFRPLCSSFLAPPQCDSWVTSLAATCPTLLCGVGTECRSGCERLGDAFFELCMNDEAGPTPFCFEYRRMIVDTCARGCPPPCEEQCQAAFGQSYYPCFGTTPFEPGCFTSALEDDASCRYDCCVERCPSCVETCELAPVPVCGDGVCEGREQEYCTADCTQACIHECDRVAMEAEYRCYDAPDGEWDWERIEACLNEVWMSHDTCVRGCARCGDGFCSPGEEESCERDCPHVCQWRCDTAERAGIEMCRTAEPVEASCFEAVYAEGAVCRQACCDASGVEWCWVEPPPVCGDHHCDWRETSYCELDCPQICHERCQGPEAEALAVCRAADVRDPACFEAAYAASATCHEACCEASEGGWPGEPDPYCYGIAAPVCGDGLCDWRENEYCAADCPGVCDQLCYYRYYEVDLPVCWAEGEPDPREPGEPGTTCYDEAYASLVSCLTGCAVCGDGYCGMGEDASNCLEDCSYCGDGFCSPSETGWCSDCPVTTCNGCVQRWFDVYQWDYVACLNLGVESELFHECIHPVERSLLESCHTLCCVEQCGPDGSGCPGVESCEVLPPPSECGNGVCEILEPNYCQVDCPEFF